MPRWDEHGKPIPDAPVRRWDANGNPIRERPVTQAEQAALDYTRRIADVSAMAARRPSPPRVRPGQRDLRSLVVEPPPMQRGQQGSATQEIGGALANINRGIPLFDEIAATGLAADELISGRASDPVDAFQRGMARQRGIEDQFSVRRPLAATGLQSTGTAASSLVPIGTGAQGIVQGGSLAAKAMGAARGAVTAAAQGAIYNLTDRGTAQERIDATNAAIPVNLALGGVLGAALTRGRPGPPRVASVDTPTGGFRVARVPPPAKPPATPLARDIRALEDAGMVLSPAIRAGRGSVVRGIEDGLQSVPILGGAIRGERSRIGEGFNRAAINRPLTVIGESLPEGVWTGTDANAYLYDRIGKAFRAGYARAPQVAIDDGFAAVEAAARQRAGMLNESNAGVLNSTIENHLARLRRGPLTGEQAGEIRSEMAKDAARYLKAGGNDSVMGEILRDIGRGLDDLIARSDPSGEAGPMLARAREAYGMYAVLRRATANSGTGTFTPRGLSAAIRAENSSVGHGDVARGEAVMQDLGGAASRVLPDTFGDSGTADRMGAGALATMWGTSGAFAAGGNPVPLAGAAAATAGLSLAATPYWLAARNIAARVPARATAAQLQAAAAELDAIAARSPEASAAILALKDRLVRGAGAYGATATSDRPGPPRR